MLLQGRGLPSKKEDRRADLFMYLLNFSLTTESVTTEITQKEVEYKKKNSG